MTAFLLSGAWAAVALLALVRHRPPPPRVRALARSAGSRPLAAHRRDPLTATGRAVSRFAWRGSASPAPGEARVAGLTALAAVTALAVVPPLAPFALLVGWAAPRWRARVAERRRLRSLQAGLGEMVDLLVLAVGAGCNVSMAVAAAGRRGTGPLAAEVRRIAAEVAHGRRLADALDGLPATAGEPTRGLAGVLAAAERYGAPLLPALQRLADEVRLQRQRRAEAAARKVPVALLFPLVLCILPAFALLTVAPLVAGSLRELRL